MRKYVVRMLGDVMTHQGQSPDPPDDLNRLSKEVYARFGLTYFYAEALFQDLVHVVATSGEHKTRGAVEEGMARASRLTLGPLVAAARELLAKEHHAELDRCVERRNFLAHGFWYERAHHLASTEGLRELISELDSARQLFVRVSSVLDAIVLSRLAAAGVSAGQLERLVAAAVEGPIEPLPDRALPKRGEKVRMVMAWALDGGLLLEDASGQLWQVSEAGLGWYIGPPAANAKRHRIADGLPADVVVRPTDAKPWDYVLRFANGVRLRVIKEAEFGRVRIEVRRGGN